MLVSDLIAHWRGERCLPSSAKWASYKTVVQTRYSRVLDALPQKIRDLPLAIFDDLRINDNLERWADGDGTTPCAARERLSVFSTLLEFGRTQGFVRRNPLKKISRREAAKRYPHVFWTDTDLAAFRITAEAMKLGHVADAVELMSLTGLHIGLATKVCFGHVLEVSIERPFDEDETRGLPELPLLPEAKDFIEELRKRDRKPAIEEILVTKRGRPWGISNLSNFILRITDAAGINHVDESFDPPVITKKTSKDLPKTWAIKLMRKGRSDDDIHSLTRWHRDDIRDLRLLAGLGEQKSMDRLVWPAQISSSSTSPLDDSGRGAA
jgi:hypothetical protein